GLVVAPVHALREARQRHLAHEAMGVEVAEAPAVLAPVRVLDDERRRPRRVEPVHHRGLVDHVELDGHEVAPDVPLDVGIRVRHGTHALAAPSVRAEEVDEDQLALGPRDPARVLHRMAPADVLVCHGSYLLPTSFSPLSSEPARSASCPPYYSPRLHADGA